MSSGDEQDVRERKKKRYHRHTPRQIQELESMFKLCPHPDDKQRMQLSRDLGLEPKQIKFWFQNRRTQMKAQHDRQDNCSLRSENDKIRCENIMIREALKNIICPHCGPSNCEDSYFDEQKLRMENARLKDELDRLSSITSKYLGRPITQLPPVHPASVTSLDLSVGSYINPSYGHSLNLDLHSINNNSSMIPSFPSFPTPLSDNEKALMAELATNAMDELIKLVQTDEPLWLKAFSDGKEALNLENYDQIFQKPGRRFLDPEIRVEASRSSGLVFISPVALVEMLMDSDKWVQLFPTIISKARTLEVLANGVGGSRNGSLLLMYGEFQILSAVVPTREFVFLRYCQQIEQGLYGVVDVSVDLPRDPSQLGPPLSRTKRLPSGCLIQQMPNDYSKVSWVEHMEIEDKIQTHRLFRDLVESGTAFGAQRWSTTLHRMCQRLHCFVDTESNSRDTGGAEGKRSMMKLSQRMLNLFYSSLSPSNINQWNTLSDLNEVRVRVIGQRSPEIGQPNRNILSAATSIWLPLSCQRLFNFLKDERTRAQWDILCHGNMVQEVTNITTGFDPGNSISLLRTCTPDQNSMLVLQETCTDESGSIIVYAPIDLQSINIAMSGEDTSNIPLLPSGFAIVPDGHHPKSHIVSSAASTSTNPLPPVMSGSILTVSFQILVSNYPSAKLNSESVETISGLITNTVHHIKSALSCA